MTGMESFQELMNLLRKVGKARLKLSGSFEAAGLRECLKHGCFNCGKCPHVMRWPRLEVNPHTANGMWRN